MSDPEDVQTGVRAMYTYRVSGKNIHDHLCLDLFRLVVALIDVIIAAMNDRVNFLSAANNVNNMESF